MNEQTTNHHDINLVDAVSRYCDTALLSFDENVLDRGLREIRSIILTFQTLRERIDSTLSRAKEKEKELNQTIQIAAVDTVVGLINGGQLSVDAIATRLSPHVSKKLGSVVRKKRAPLNQRVSETRKKGIRYRDPVTGLTWSGRGRTPVWLAHLCINGKTKEDFLVDRDLDRAVNQSLDIHLAAAKDLGRGEEGEGSGVQMQQQAAPQVMPGDFPVPAWPDADIGLLEVDDNDETDSLELS
jgi:DNA-binding protein H-NS